MEGKAKFPGFFKVYLSTSSQRLPLPLLLCSMFKGAKPWHASLRNSGGQLWPVRVCKYRNQWFFENGWAEFVVANHVQEGDFFFFDYDGNSTFDYKHLGGDRCGKVVVPNLEKHNGDNYMVLDETDGEESSDEEEEENTESDDEMINGFLKQEIGNLKLSAGGGPSYDKKGKSVVVDDESLGEEAGERKRKKPSSKYCGSERKVAECESKPRFCSHEEVEDIFQYGVISPPKNPYFVAKLRLKRRGYQIPGDVISVFNLQIAEKIKLLDEEGRDWTAEVKHWKDGRVWIAAGWRGFCKWNRLRVEDRCICEFILGNNRQVLHLKTRIIRNNSWLPNAAVAAATKKNPGG